jgi:ATP-binding cassette subfamily F protein uup
LEQFRSDGAAVKGQKNETNISKPQPSPSKKRLSYLEQREWDQIESLIHKAEEKLRKLQCDLEDPSVTSDPKRLQESYAQLQPAQAEVDRLYERWAELEAKLV